ncbi:MAG: 16S rRNA (cytidine(1402)-2'-O)-methyltransferase [Actinomycetota bacterium]|nr:16S rRNA (cytidine(1402)-2'-O)-methyltransferase [Actinomycetota bacterium]
MAAAPPVRIRARGHPLVGATHHKSLEITADSDLTARGSCIVGVGAHWDAGQLRSLSGRIGVTLVSGGHRFCFECTVSPTFLGGSSLVFRRGADLAERTFAFDATASAADVDRALVEDLRAPGAELLVTLQPVQGRPAGPGALYVVGLPVGNDGDLSPRARRVLEQVDVVLAEDTRKYRSLARGAGIAIKDLRSHHVGNESRGAAQAVELLAAGTRVAVVTDAGTPVVSDPGFALVRAAREAGIPVRPVPGPSAPIVALSACGIPADRFTFAGFLPRKAAARRAALAELGSNPGAIVVFEAPHRLAECLEDVAAVLPGRDLCVARELTKIHEEIVGTRTERAAEVVAGSPPRGEYTLVIGPAPAIQQQLSGPAADLVCRMVRNLPAVPTRVLADAVAQAAPMSRRDAYRLVLSLRRRNEDQGGGT